VCACVRVCVTESRSCPSIEKSRSDDECWETVTKKDFLVACRRRRRRFRE
jgi:hypothetical protein